MQKQRRCGEFFIVDFSSFVITDIFCSHYSRNSEERSKMFRALLTLCLIGVVAAQVPGLGGCPNVDTISTFDIEKYAGKWYEQYRYFSILELGGKCVTADYSPNDNTSMKIVESQINSLTGIPCDIEVSASIVDPADPGKLAVHVPLFPINLSYWILDTDYDSYAAVLSCKSLFIAHFERAWIFTRKQNASEAVIEKARQAFRQNNLNIALFEKTDQIHC